MTPPVRIQRRRTRGWRMPEGAVYVGRGSIWGNPFVVGQPSGVFAEGQGAHGRGETLIAALTPEQSIEFYETALRGMLKPEMHPHGHLWLHNWWNQTACSPIEMIGALRGKSLACWCPLDRPCHADVLLELANAPAAKRRGG